MRTMRLTPEQEAYRLERLREVMSRARPQEWRDNQKAGIRRAIAEGRIDFSKSNTPEAHRKTADKLRGRKRPPEVIEKIRAKNLGKKRSLETRAKLGLRAKRQWDAMTEEQKKEKIVQLRAKAPLKHPPRSLSWKENHSRKMRNFKWSEEIIERRAEPMRGRPQTALLTRKGPDHVCALHGAIRSPDNIVYEFSNLTDWIRNNEHLFLPDDVRWRPNSSKKGVFCRATKGLINLFGRGKHVNGSWKGWTVFSHTEQVTNQGEDLLKREVLETQ